MKIALIRTSMNNSWLYSLSASILRQWQDSNNACACTSWIPVVIATYCNNQPHTLPPPQFIIILMARTASTPNGQDDHNRCLRLQIMLLYISHIKLNNNYSINELKAIGQGASPHTGEVQAYNSLLVQVVTPTRVNWPEDLHRICMWYCWFRLVNFVITERSADFISTSYDISGVPEQYIRRHSREVSPTYQSLIELSFQCLLLE